MVVSKRAARQIVEEAHELGTRGAEERRIHHGEEIRLHPFTAVGTLIEGAQRQQERTRQRLATIVQKNSPRKLEERARNAARESHVCLAATYAFYAARVDGATVEEAAEYAKNRLELTGSNRRIPLAPTYKDDLPGQGTHQNRLHVFFDKDETLTGRTSESEELYNREVLYLLQKMTLKNKESGQKIFERFITSNTKISPDKKFIDDVNSLVVPDLLASRNEKQLLSAYFDGVNCIPSIPPFFSVQPQAYYNPHPGKVYNELVQSRSIPKENTVVIGDSFTDLSAERGIPLKRPLPLLTTAYVGSWAPAEGRPPTGEEWFATIMYIWRLGGDKGFAHGFEMLSQPQRWRLPHECTECTLEFLVGNDRVSENMYRHNLQFKKRETVALYMTENLPNVGIIGVVPTRLISFKLRLEQKKQEYGARSSTGPENY